MTTTENPTTRTRSTESASDALSREEMLSFAASVRMAAPGRRSPDYLTTLGALSSPDFAGTVRAEAPGRSTR